MSKGTGKVEFDVPSMRHGASVAGQLAHAFEESAGRVGGLPLPEGTPPEIAGELRAVSAALRRAARSAAAQRSWLRFHAELALIADGPMAALLGLLAPPLVGPFELPNLHLTRLKHPPKNPPGPDWLWKGLRGGWDFGRGGAYAVKSLGEGLLRTANTIEVARNPLLRKIQRELRDVPVLGLEYTWTKESDAGLAYARKDPIEFLKLMGKDAIAYGDHNDGKHMYALGRNTVDAGSLLLPFLKIGAAGRAAKLAQEASAEAGRIEELAQAARISAQNRRNRLKGYAANLEKREGETDAAFADRKAAAVKKGEQAEAPWSDAKAEHKTTTEQLKDAKTAADTASEKAKEIRHEESRKAVQEAGKASNTAGQGAVVEHAHEAAEHGREHERADAGGPDRDHAERGAR